jgi:hypothetical protein
MNGFMMNAKNNLWQRVLVLILISAAVILFFPACKSETTQPPASDSSTTTQPSASDSLSTTDPEIMVRLDSVEFVGEFDSVLQTVVETGEELRITTDDAGVNDGRFVVFKYTFTTLELENEDRSVTYGGTVTMWRGDDINAADASVGGAHLTCSDDDAKVVDGELEFGYSSLSFIYGTGEEHTQWYIAAIPNAVPLEEINIHFSTIATVSDIGYDFKAD